MKTITNLSLSVFVLFYSNLLIAQFSTANGVESVIQFGGNQVKAIQDAINQAGEMGNLGSVLGTTQRSLGHLGTIFSAAKDATDLYNASQTLDRNECVPDFTTDASAMMPSACSEKPDCQSCYQNAINNLNTIRKSLGRLSCIFSNTKTFTESAIAFGDNVSGIHGVLGLAWQTERQGIQNEFNKLKNTYDNKYIELMRALEKNLKKIGKCENKFGLQDWYGRFGFIYFEMMKEKYKRPL